MLRTKRNKEANLRSKDSLTVRGSRIIQKANDHDQINTENVAGVPRQ